MLVLQVENTVFFLYSWVCAKINILNSHLQTQRQYMKVDRQDRISILVLCYQQCQNMCSVIVSPIG